MERITEAFKTFLLQEDAQSLIEYSLISSIVAIGCITAMWLMKEQIAAIFSLIAAHL